MHVDDGGRAEVENLDAADQQQPAQSHQTRPNKRGHSLTLPQGQTKKHRLGPQRLLKRQRDSTHDPTTRLIQSSIDELWSTQGTLKKTRTNPQHDSHWDHLKRHPP